MNDTNRVMLSGEVLKVRTNNVEKLGGVAVINFILKTVKNRRTLYTQCSWWEPKLTIAEYDHVVLEGELVNKKTKTTDKATGNIIDGWEKAVSVESLSLSDRTQQADQLRETIQKIENKPMAHDEFGDSDIPF